MNELVWDRCYDDGWGGLIVPEAFAHPAKYAHGLILRIVEYGLGRGWWRAGDTIGDPFGGVALGGIVCGYHGLNWIGVELESQKNDPPGSPFVELGNRNLDLHRAKWKALGYDVSVRLVQGDSREFAAIVQRLAIMDGLAAGREFAEIVGEVQGCVTSPPYVSGGHHPDQTGAWNTNGRGQGMTQDEANYGSSPGQIGRLRAGQVDSVITSPPYAESLGNENGIDYSKAKGPNDGLKPSVARDSVGGSYGHTPGQIGSLKQGRIDAVISSPPYAESLNSGGPVGESVKRARAGRKQVETHYTEDSNPQNIGNLKSGSVDGVIGEPDENDVDMDRRILRGGGLCDVVRGEERGRRGPWCGNHDRPEGSISATEDQGVLGGQGISRRTPLLEEGVPEQVEGADKRLLGVAVESKVGEPMVPSRSHSTLDKQEGQSRIRSREHTQAEKGEADNNGPSDHAPNVGRGQIYQGDIQDNGCWPETSKPRTEVCRETYWEAMHGIYTECHKAIKPGGVLCVIVKDYVSKGKRVPLCDDTLKLLVSLGFEPVERIHAMLVKEWTESTLFEGDVTRTKERKSFFRRLAEKKGSPRIDYEEVLVVRRGLR